MRTAVAAVGAVGAITPQANVSAWTFHPHPEVWLILGGAVLGFWYLVRRVGPTAVGPGEPVITRKQARLFGASVLLLWIFSDYPVHDLSERYLYSVHMLQHLVFSLVVPPLLIIATPAWLQRILLRPKWIDFSVKRICRPFPAAVLFNVVIAIGHAPFYVNYTLEHDAVHFFAHLLLFTVSMIMWFPVLNRLPEYPALKQPAAMVYLFIQSIIPNVPVAFLAFAEGVVYKFYATVPRPFPLTAVEDQQIAAAIMKVGGTLIIWSIILVQFLRWYDRTVGDPFSRGRPVPRVPVAAPGSENAGAGEGETPDDTLPEVLTWDHVESELSRTQPRR